MLIPLLLFSISTATIFASSSDDEELQIRLSDKTSRYGAVPENNDRRRNELIKKIAYTCNPTPCDSFSFDYSQSGCLTLKNAYCSFQSHPRKEYLDALEELFYPNGPWEKPGNYGKKCCLAALRNGCNLCTCAGYLAPCVVSSTLILTGIVCTECATAPNQYSCNCTCTNPAVYDSANELVGPAISAWACLSTSSSAAAALSEMCVKCVSHPAMWSETPQVPGNIQDVDGSADH